MFNHSLGFFCHLVLFLTLSIFLIRSSWSTWTKPLFDLIRLSTLTSLFLLFRSFPGHPFRTCCLRLGFRVFPFVWFVCWGSSFFHFQVLSFGWPWLTVCSQLVSCKDSICSLFWSFCLFCRCLLLEKFFVSAFRLNFFWFTMWTSHACFLSNQCRLQLR